MAFGISVGQGFQFGGQAISDLFGAAGDAAEASAYGQAAAYATQNAQLEKESTNIQQAQLSRHIFQAVGGQVAQTAGAGLAMSGSALSAYKSSISQGALAHGLLAVQGQVNVNSYEEAASQYKGMQSAAQAASGGGIFGGILSGIGSVLGFLSDDRAKQNVVQIGTTKVPGVNLYLFQYKGSERIFKGVLASEVLKHAPYAASYDKPSGLYRVDYEKLGVTMEEVANAT